MTLSAAQLELRKHAIGSSEIGAIAGLNPWRGPLDVWLSKTGRDDRDQNMQQSLGHYLEPIIARIYRDKLEDEIELVPGTSMLSEEEPWVVVTPDYHVLSKVRNTRLLEIKNVGWRVAHHWQSDRAPDYVFAQAQYQMRGTGIDVADVAALLGGRDFYVITLPYEKDFADALSEIARVFLVDYVLPDKPPPPDATDGWKEYVAKRFPRHTSDQMLTASEGLEKLVGELRQIRKDQDLAESRRTELETQIKNAIGENCGLRGDGWQITWKAPAQGTVSWKNVAEALKPAAELIEQHRSQPARRFLLTEKDR